MTGHRLSSLKTPALAHACAWRLAMTITAWFATASVATACKDTADCSYLGQCQLGVCKCDEGWRGSSCSQLDLSPASSDGGLQLESAWTWGGGAVWSNDSIGDPPSGLWHAFALALTNHCGILTYQTNGVVVHAVSPQPSGPYRVVQPRAFTRDAAGSWDNQTVSEPHIQRAPDGKWVLWYMSSNSTASARNCTEKDEAGFRSNEIRRMGYAFADSPFGPWTRVGAPLLPPQTDPFHSEVNECNPAVAFHPSGNGSLVLVYRGGPLNGLGFARAENWRGPYTRILPRLANDNHTDDKRMYRVFNCTEDPYLFWAEGNAAGVLHLLCHDTTHGGGLKPGTHPGVVGDHYISLDGGSSWTPAAPGPDGWWSYTTTVEYADGRRLDFVRRERPYLVLQPAPWHVHPGMRMGGNHTWEVQTPLALLTSAQPCIPNTTFHDWGSRCKSFTFAQPISRNGRDGAALVV